MLKKDGSQLGMLEMQGSKFFCGLFTKKYGLIFKGSAASDPTHSQRHLYARPFASLMFRARDFMLAPRALLTSTINDSGIF